MSKEWLFSALAVADLRAFSTSLEILHLENSIDSSSESSAWLNLRSGSSIKVTILKLYAPDFRHFYLFSADIVDKRVDENHLANYSKGQSYNSI
mgnify:CR=1 FL=1